MNEATSMLVLALLPALGCGTAKQSVSAITAVRMCRTPDATGLCAANEASVPAGLTDLYGSAGVTLPNGNIVTTGKWLIAIGGDRTELAENAQTGPTQGAGLYTTHL